MQPAAAATDRLRKRKESETQTEAHSCFQFVNANPQSESERKDARALIRTNATNFHWRHIKRASVRPKTPRSIVRRAHSEEAPYESSNPILAALDSDAWHNLQDKRHVRNATISRAQNGFALSDRRRSYPPIGVAEDPPISGSSPMDLMGIGHVDPFEVYPSDLPKQFVSPLLAQGSF